MWQWCNIGNRANNQTRRLHRANGAFATGTRPFDKDIHFAHIEVIASGTGCILRSKLPGKGGGLAAAFEATASAAGPALSSAGQVGNGDNRIVKRSVNMHLSNRHALAFTFGRCPSVTSSLWSRHACSFVLTCAQSILKKVPQFRPFQQEQIKLFRDLKLNNYC